MGIDKVLGEEMICFFGVEVCMLSGVEPRVDYYFTVESPYL